VQDVHQARPEQHGHHEGEERLADRRAQEHNREYNLDQEEHHELPHQLRGGQVDIRPRADAEGRREAQIHESHQGPLHRSGRHPEVDAAGVHGHDLGKDVDALMTMTSPRATTRSPSRTEPGSRSSSPSRTKS
jgi:hypothetical protein